MASTHLLLLLPACAAAQILPDKPVAVAGGRLVISGQASVAAASDDPGYFNYSSYDDDLMRLVRFDGAGSFRVSDRLSLVGDLRVEGSSSGGSWRLRPYAAFVRIRPWPARAFDIQAGIVPTVFGAFSRRAYATDNPLIGFPLAYQYLTSLRADAVPLSADDLLRMRGRGWFTRYPVGDTTGGVGLPVIDGLHYQSGVEVHAGSRPVEIATAVTSGSLSVPSGEYARPGRQLSARVAFRPNAGVVLGVSASHGTYLAQSITGAFAASAPGAQTAVGFDGELSREHWLVRAEGVYSRWSVPLLQPPYIASPLGAFAIDVEARYRIRPGLYVAARVDRLDFSDVAGSAGVAPWEAPVRRLEAGGGYSLLRNVLVKVSWQRNWRNDAGITSGNVVAAQLTTWF